MANLKNENNKMLAGLILAVVIASTIIQFGFKTIPQWKELLAAGGISAILATVCVFLTHLLPHNLKHKIVFTRVKDEMPGGRVASLCENDPRINLHNVASKWPAIFDKSVPRSEVNSLWYQGIYRPVKNYPEVLQAHQNFLLYRDAMSGLIVLALLVGAWDLISNFWISEDIKLGVYLLFSISILTTLLAARFSGNRFVVNTVASAL